MDPAYLGIVVENSLRDGVVPQGFTVVARVRHGDWDFALVRAPAADVDRLVGELQRHMVTDDTWYAHFFRGDDLIVVFRDAAFQVTTDPASWTPAVQHGLAGGVPLEQLDFYPRTRAAAETFFGLR